MLTDFFITQSGTLRIQFIVATKFVWHFSQRYEYQIKRHDTRIQKCPLHQAEKYVFFISNQNYSFTNPNSEIICQKDFKAFCKLT